VKKMKQPLLIVAFLFITASTGFAQANQLGKVEFPTSGSAQAQAHFIRGLAALHSFWYEEALEAFRESTKVEPDFMMGYWGEAMAHNHPLWSEQDTAEARAVIAKIKDTPKLTPRERTYLNAVKVLYAEGEKDVRDAAYSSEMEKLYRDYPNDLDAAAFYSLSLLGLVRMEEKSYRLQARAGAIALDVYQKNPNHPGAAHYIIHAFDDPDHAILALPAARRYASIAPEAHHARHMPSHIFLQLGMWPDAAASNEFAWESSEAWMKRKSLSPSVRDYHSLHWLLYVYLQQGRYRKAEELLSVMKKTMAESTYDNKLRPGYYQNNYASMAAAFIVETERWDLATSLFPDGATTSPAAGGSHGAHGSRASNDGPAVVRTSNRGQQLPVFVRGLAAAIKNRPVDLAQPAMGESRVNPPPSIQQLEVQALAASVKGEHDKAVQLMTEAAAMEERTGAPSGPPGIIKPAHELFGEVLLRAGKHEAAAEQFKIALLRQPNRARSLLGLARTLAKAGKEAEAIAMYGKLVDQWKEADSDLPELSEAKEYAKRSTK